MTKVKLIAGQGADEANFGGGRYRVNNDRTVMVEEAAVGPLVAIGGFVVADLVPPVEVPHGTIRLINERDPTTTCSHDGITYTPDADGVVTVPVGIVVDLAPHGFVPVPRSAIAIERM
jgi:hypothetical protein